MAIANRRRPRIDVDQEETPQASAEMKKLARDAHRYHEAAKANAKLSKDASDKLYALMTHEGVREFDFIARIDNKPVSLIVEIIKGTAKVQHVVDIVKLKAAVSAAMFMKIVSATQKAVKEIAGEAVLQKCLVEKPADAKNDKESLVVKVRS